MDYLVSLIIEGTIECTGLEDAPVLFTSVAAGQPWGEIDHQSATGQYSYTFFTNGGGDLSKPFGHSDSQPVIGGSNCNLTLDHVYIIDNPGKAMGLNQSVLNMQHSLISRCDTGGELAQTLVNLNNTYYLDMPNGDDFDSDDDNDCLYLLSPWSGGSGMSIIENCVFASGKDDGIDHNKANVYVNDCVIEDFDNEGIACSNENYIEIHNTLILGWEQGIEAGYGNPAVMVDHCTLIGNETGLRFGDWYDWGCSGTMTVKNTVVYNSALHNVLNFDVLSKGPVLGAISLTYSMVNQTEYDSCLGCVTGVPVFSGDFLLSDDSPGIGGPDDGSDMGILP